MNCFRKAVFCAVIAALCATVAARAASGVEASRMLTIPQLQSAPPMSAVLDGAWSNAALFHLAHEGTYRKPAAEDTIVRIGIYAQNLYIAFDARQQEPLVASQVSDGTGVLTGDAVMVHLWPDGLQGFAYWFATNVHGARDQYSSENSAYAPAWTAFGQRTATGYVSILKIPLSAMHVQSGTEWRAQFHRIVVSSNSNYVWELEPGQASYVDGRYGGRIAGLKPAAAGRTAPRLQVYGLGAFSPASLGGFSSRMGADVSLPVTATTSLFAAAHPDFSNVEIDQQSISPTEFARRFAEVRPFFTQALGNFNRQPDFSMPMSTLYTPVIPAFRDGYGLEGRQGLFSFAAFDAAGYSRNDNAQTFSLSDPHQRMTLSYQRVGVDVPGFHDVVNDEGFSFVNPRGNLTFFANTGNESGTSVSGNAAYGDLGGMYATSTTQIAFALQKMGPQFAPADGYANQPPGAPGIAGYTAYAGRQINYAPTARILDVGFSASYDRYHAPGGRTNQADFADEVRIDFKNQLTVSAMQMISSLATCAPIDPSTCRNELLPYNSSGITLGYALNTAHPSAVSYLRGQYYHGTLSSWTRSFSVPLTARSSVLLEADDTLYASGAANEPGSKQWLERAGVNYQFNSFVSADVGVRRIIGVTQPFAFAPFGPAPAFGQPRALDATNLSAALHFFRGNNELYVVYGNPNELTTTKTLFVKLIRYVGAGKGT